jgi:hypothetical protein
MHNIKSIFEIECKDLLIDKNLLKRINLYQTGFVNKNIEHISFFGGNTTGVQVVRFLPSDRDKWFDEVLETSDGPLEEKLHALPTVNSEWHISSDTMNLSCVWLAHIIFNSPNLNTEQKHTVLIDIFLILQYKYVTSILFRYFRYPAEKATAEATYSLLSYKYALKLHGSWSAFLLARAEELISSDSIHYKTIVSMDEDKDVTYLLSDSQGRIRDMIKNIYSVFDRVHKQGIKISTTSSVTTDHEGEEILKDKSKGLLAYGRYLNSIVTDKNSFIKLELIDLISKLVHTAPPKLIIESLEWISTNYKETNTKIIEEALNETLLHSFDYLTNNRDLIRNNSDLGVLLSRLKGVYMSSRSTDVVLIELRIKVEKIVRMATGSKNDSVISSVRTAVLLYIVIRSLAMRHYSNN